MQTNYQTLKVELLSSGILQIILICAEKLNVLTQLMLDELHMVFEYAHESDDVKALLLTGTGKAFCAGVDIKRLQNLDAQAGRNFAIHGQKIFRRLETLGKPSLVAVNGIALGGGCELAMAASMRIADKRAKFGQPEVKLGVIPGYGGTQRLARLIGKGRALELCLTGKLITAERALNWGLVNEIVDSEHLLVRAQAILIDLLKSCAPLAMASVMQIIDNGYDLPLEEAIRLEAIHFGICCATGDQKRGITAFFEKQMAKFQGE